MRGTSSCGIRVTKKAGDSESMGIDVARYMNDFHTWTIVQRVSLYLTVGE